MIRGVFSSPGSTGKSGRTDATGRATIGPLAPGDYVGFLEFGPGQGMGMMFYGGMGPSQPMGSQIGEQVSFRVVALQTVEVALTRPQMASLTGMIRDETGAIRNALVMLAPDRGKKPGHDISTFINTQRARTNSDGVYRFEGLKPGKYTLTIQAQKDGMAFLSKVEIQGSGEQQNDVFLQAGTLEVRLQTEGKAAAGIMLMLTPAQNGIQIRFFLSGSRSKTATSDADGLVEYRRVPPGKYTLRFKDGDYLQPKSDPIEVAAGGTTQHEMAAEWAAILRYVCKPAPGRKPLQAIQVETTREGDKPKMSWNRATSGKVKALKPGRYSVRARRANQQDKWTQPRTIELKPGASELLEIILP